MYKVLITTSAFTSNACSTSSITTEFSTPKEAIAAVANAVRNNNTVKNIIVSAVFLNPPN